jgi:hypothetical protein
MGQICVLQAAWIYVLQADMTVDTAHVSTVLLLQQPASCSDFLQAGCDCRCVGLLCMAFQQTA